MDKEIIIYQLNELVSLVNETEGEFIIIITVEAADGSE